MVLDENFREFIRLLNVNDVKYLVVGGFAVAYHGLKDKVDAQTLVKKNKKKIKP